MKRAKIVSLLVAVFVVMSSYGIQAQDKQEKIVPEANIKETKIIRLHYMGGITPPELTVQPGTTVVWVNDSRAMLELQFEGKQVTLACKSPVHFNIDENGSFISDRIPQDSVASLCFVEKGEFTYVARKTPGNTADEPRMTVKEFKGKIIVK
jgi:plastocyanin